MKYLIDASDKDWFNLITIMGIILIKLISSPNHTVNQLLALTEITVPRIKNVKNNNM